MAASHCRVDWSFCKIGLTQVVSICGMLKSRIILLLAYVSETLYLHTFFLLHYINLNIYFFPVVTCFLDIGYR
jgi:hypothetical protein